MNNSARSIKTHKDADLYIRDLRDGSPTRKDEARKALIRSGILTKNGNKKRRIVSWE